MPDFRVISQAPVPRADIGASYDRGLGNSTGSDFAALVGGLQEGLSFGANLSAKLQETARLNDPEQIALEKLQLDIKNRTGEQALLKSKFDYGLDQEFGRGDRIDTRRSSNAASDLNESSARLNNTSASLKEAYGPDLMESEISQNYNSGGGGKSAAGLTPAARELNIRSALDDKRQAQQALDKLIPPIMGRELRPDEAAPEQNLSPSERASAQAYKDVIFESEQTIARMKQPETPQETTQRYKYSNDSAREKFNNTVQQRALGNKTARFQAAEADLAQADKAAGYATSPYADSNTAFRSWAGPISRSIASYKSTLDPEEKALISQGLAANLNLAGPDLLDSFGQTLPENERKPFTQISDAARAYSNDPNLLTPIQKDLQQAGLPPKFVADSQQGMATFTSYIKEGEPGVKDSEFKAALRGNPYVSAMQEAFANDPTAVPFVGPINTNTNGVDTTGQPGAQMYLQFRNAAGKIVSNTIDGQPTPVNTPYQKTPQSDAIISMLGTFSTEQTQMAQGEQAARIQGEAANQNTQAMQQQVNTPPAAQPPQGGKLEAYGAGPQVVPAQAQAAAQPQATPTPTPQPAPAQAEEAPKPLRHIYDVKKGDKIDKETGPKAFRYRKADGEVIIRNNAAGGLEYSETGGQSDGEYLDAKGNPTEAGRKRGDSFNKNPAMKDLSETLTKSADQIKTDQTTLDRFDTYLGRVERARAQGIFGTKGKIPSTFAQYQQLLNSAGLGSDRAQELTELKQEGERLMSQVLRDYVSQGKVSSTVNTPVEQELFAKAIFDKNTEFENAKVYTQLEKARLGREVEVTNFMANLGDRPDLNSPAKIRAFVNTYLASPASKAFELNPERYKVTDGQIQEIPGKENLDQFTERPHISPEEFLLSYGNEGRQFGEVGPDAGGTYIQGGEVPTPTPAAPGAQLQKTGFQGDATTNPQGQTDVVATPTALKEADLAENQQSFLADAGEAPAVKGQNGPTPASLLIDRPDQVAAKQERFPGDPGSTPNQPLPGSVPIESAMTPRAEPAKPAVSAWEANGEKFESPEEAETYRRIVTEMRKEGGVNATTWVEDVIGGQTSEELNRKMLAFGKKIGMPQFKDLSDRQLNMYAAAREEVIRSTPGLMKAAAEMVVPGLETLAVGKKLEPVVAGLEKITGATLGAASKIPYVSQKVGQGIAAAKTVPYVGPLVRGAGKVGTAAAEYGPSIGTNVAVDAGFAASAAHRPGESYFEGKSLEAAKAMAKMSLVTQLGLAPVVKAASRPFKAVTGQAGAPPDFTARVLTKSGVTREMLEDIDTQVKANPGSDPRQFFTPEMKNAATDLASNPDTAQIVNNPALMAKRLDAAEKATEQNFKDMGIDNPKTLQSLNQEFADRVVNASDSTAQVEAVQAIAAHEAEQEILVQSAKVLDNFTQEGVSDINKFTQELDSLTGRTTKLPAVDTTTTTNPAENYNVRATSMETVKDAMHKEANAGFSNHIDPVQVDEKLWTRFVAHISNERKFPLGKDTLEYIAKHVGGSGTEFPKTGRAFDEMRRYLKSHGSPVDTVQAEKMIGEIEDTMNRNFQLQDSTKGPKHYTDFMDAQARTRGFEEKLGERIAVLRKVQSAVGKTTGTRNAHDLVFGKNQTAVEQAFGKTAADELSVQLQATDRATKAMDDIVRRGKLTALSREIIDDMAANIKESKGLIDSKHFVEKIIKHPDPTLADRVAQSLGYLDRQGFADSTLRYVRDKMENNLAKEMQKGQVNQARGPMTDQQLTGLTPSELKNAMSLLTKPQREALEAGLTRQRQIDTGKYLFDKAPNSPNLPGNVNWIHRLFWMNKTAAGVDFIGTKMFQKMSVRDKQTFAKIMGGEDPVKLQSFIKDVSTRMKPGGAGAYGNYMDYERAVNSLRAMQNAFAVPAYTQRTEDEREADRSESAKAQYRPTTPKKYMAEDYLKSTMAAPKKKPKYTAEDYLRSQGK